MADPYGIVGVVVGVVVVVAGDCNIANGIVIRRRFGSRPRTIATPNADSAAAGCSIMFQVAETCWLIVGEIPVSTIVVVAQSDRAVLHDPMVSIIMCV